MKPDNKPKDQKEEIDEGYLMSMMAQGVQKEGLDGFATTAEILANDKESLPVKKKVKIPKEQQYRDLFFKPSDTQARGGKSVYIRPEFHERLMRLVQVVGEDKISLYDYLDNVLRYHFEDFDLATFIRT